MIKLSRLLASLALAASVTGALAWDLAVPATNATVRTVMVVPPVVDIASDGLGQVAVRGSNVAVVAGARYRIGSQVIVAAHAGNMTNTMVTTTGYYTNGIPVALAGAQWAATNSIPVYTNTYVTLAPITVPSAGISGYDGTVRWYRARTPEQDDVQFQLTVGGGVVSLIDDSGGAFTYTASAADPNPLYDYAGSLYVSMTGIGTNSVSARAW